MKFFLAITIILLGFIACDAQIPNRSLFVAKEHGRFGYINSNGKFVIPPSFDFARPFSDGLASVMIDSLWGYIDSLGQIVIPPRFYVAESFSSDRALVLLNPRGAKWAFIDKSGDVVFRTNSETESFKEGFAATTIRKRTAYYNVNGEIQIRTNYPYGGSFSEGIAKVWTGNKSKYIDTNGRTIFKLSGMGHQGFSEGLAAVRMNGKNVYVNKKGEIEIDSLNDDWACFDFSEGLAQVTIPGIHHKSGFINKRGEIVIPVKYQVYDFHDGLAAFTENDKWGFFNKAGEVAIPPDFDFVEYYGFRGGLCWARKGEQRGYINRNGDFVWTIDQDFMYQTIDTTIWKLEPLNVSVPIVPNRYVISNKPHIIKSDSVNSLKLVVKPDEISPFADKFIGCKIYLINGTKDTLLIPAQDGTVKLLLQAKDEKGEWRYIENYIDSWCGNSRHDIPLMPKEYFVFAAPVFSGDFQTQLRVTLFMKDKSVIRSNEYEGSISKEQFLKRELGGYD